MGEALPGSARKTDPPAPRTATSAYASLITLLRYILAESRFKSAIMLAFLFLGSLTEGASIVLLIPILHMMGSAHRNAGYALKLPASIFHSAPTLQVSLITVLGLFVLTVLVRGLLMMFKEIYSVDLLLFLMNKVRSSLFNAIAGARWGFIATLRQSELQHALTADIDRVHVAILQAFMLIQAGVLVVMYGVISLVISPGMTLMAVGFGVALIAVMHPVRRAAAAYGETLTGQRRDQYRVVSDFLSGIKSAKSINAEPVYTAQLETVLGEMRTANRRFTQISATGSLLSQTISAVSVAAFSYVAFIFYNLPLAKIVVLLFVFMRISPRFSSIHENLQGILLNLPAFDAMRALETRCRGEAEPMMDASAGAPLLRSQIRFEQVSFAYRGADHAQIFNASFDIPVNRITALIGPSGAGKSTLADLALGLIEPSTGRILIDDVVLDGGNQRAWRDHIAYVPQDVFLLHDTISGNLLIANPHASEADIWLALKQANAEGFVRKLPDRLDTVLGERGVRLSGGERQRIALARALLRRPRLLILDEGTSALDWESQAMIARSIESLRGQMTILTIAHRPSMIAFADHVIAINGGRIVERGSYSDLIRRSDSHLSHLVAGEAAADRRVS